MPLALFIPAFTAEAVRQFWPAAGAANQNLLFF